VVLVLLSVVALSEILRWLGLVPYSPDPNWSGILIVLPAALFANWVVMDRLERLPMAALGLTGGWSAGRQLASGTAVGVALIAAVILVLVLFGWVTWLPGGGAVAFAAAALPLTGVLLAAAWAEELLVRGYPLQVLAEGSGAGVAIGLTAIVFGLLHAANPNIDPLALVNLTLAGVLLGVAYWRTYSLWFATGVHFGWNWAMGLSGLSVSGLDLGMPVRTGLSGPAVWTGGAFGPEGGLIVTFATAIGIVWMWRTTWLRRSLEILSLSPLPERYGRTTRGWGIDRNSEEIQ
jgi:membrane protease YdiL (CAAX protease family)